MALTDTAIRALKPTGKLQKISDSGGLQLWVMPTGARLWRYAYRYSGSQKVLAIGPYPTITLAEARKRRDDAKALLLAGTDPSAARRVEKLTRELSSAVTLASVAAELLEKKEREGLAATTLTRIRSQLTHVSSDLAKRPIAEISAPEILASLRKIEARGKFETATRTKELLGAIFRFGMATGRCATDPTIALKGALTSHRVRHRAAITDAAAFGALLRAIDGYEGQPTTRAALQLLALTFVRPGELRLAAWSEFDLEGSIWRIPAGRMKMRRPHEVPLAQQALKILRELHDLTGGGPLLFPGNRSAKRPISENTLNAALRRIGFTRDEMTSHGFRAAASTLLNETGKFSSDAIERALAHQDPDEVRRAYARGTFFDERVAMARWWADYLDQLREGGKVISMATKRARTAT